MWAIRGLKSGTGGWAFQGIMCVQVLEKRGYGHGHSCTIRCSDRMVDGGQLLPGGRSSQRAQRRADGALQFQGALADGCRRPLLRLKWALAGSGGGAAACRPTWDAGNANGGRYGGHGRGRPFTT